jgi:DNA adenine methylase
MKNPNDLLTHRGSAVIFASANVKASTPLASKDTRAMKKPRGFPPAGGAALRSMGGPLEPSEGAKPGATSLKPPLKWAGGKRWLLPSLAPLWSTHASKRYVEPFCGGLACALGLRPPSALLNDINAPLINFYTELQRGLEVTIPMKNDEASYYRHRSRFNELTRTQEGRGAEAAQLFYYLNRTGYNGLCRFNQSGEFNVPFGRHTSINYITDFSGFPAAMKKWTFINSDIESLPLDRHDFVYADPPYDVEFTTYSAGGFSWEDQIRTAEFLAAHRGPVVLSNQATPRIVRLYKKLGFNVSYLAGPRRISCNGDRTAAREVLATKGF